MGFQKIRKNCLDLCLVSCINYMYKVLIIARADIWARRFSKGKERSLLHISLHKRFPSILATGMLKPSVDDPYDMMRRNRLVEPRSRARSISPLRQANQQNTRSQSVVRCSPTKDRSGIKVATVEPMSRTEWFDCSPVPSLTSGPGTGADRLIDDSCSQVVSNLFV